jgi:hypothetical protein
MVFKYCKKCYGMRQFLPNGYGKNPRHCDICNTQE